MKDNHDKISYTAILCARSLGENTNIPYAKEIWKELKREKLTSHGVSFAFTNFLARGFKGIGLIHSFLEGRYLAVNSTLKKLKNPYVLELAAGVTPRGLEFADENKYYIESDLADLVKIKKKILQKLNRDKVNIIPLNVLNKKDLMNVGEIYRKSKSKKPLAVIHSGLWTYLDKEEQAVMSENIKSLLKKYSPKGYWVSLDFRPKSLQKNLFFRFFRRGISKKTGRQPTRFSSQKELVEYMNKKGFSVKIIKNKEIVSRMNTPKKFKLNVQDVLRQGRDFEVYVMRLKNGN